VGVRSAGAANEREMACDLSSREASGDRTMPPLQTNRQANRGEAAVVRSCDNWWEKLQSQNRHRSNGKDYKVRLADGRFGGIDAQLEVEVKFGNKQVIMSLLILPGVVDPLVLRWNFLKQVGTEIRCAGHEIIILARNRRWLEEKLSVAVVQQVNELDNTTAFLEAGNIEYGRTPDQNEG